MKALIIEDEEISFRRLRRMLRDLRPHMEIDGPLTTTSEVISRLSEYSGYDIIFSDIRLRDHDVFDAFQAVMPECMVIFTTAYDEYALKAFKNNGVEYLLKPIEKESLSAALMKVESIAGRKVFGKDKLDMVIVSPDAMSGEFFSKRGNLHSITTEWPEINEERLLKIEQTCEIAEGIHVIAHIPQNHPMPKGNQNLFVQDANGKYVHDDFRHAPLTNWGLGFVEFQKGWTMLDIGCGGGATLKRLTKRSEWAQVYGIDISEESVAKARKVNANVLDKQVFVCQGSAEKLPYEDGKFDLVTAVETVYFWPNLSDCLQEVRRVLKKGGKFAIMVEVLDADSVWTNVVEGMTAYSPEQLQSLLNEAGFIQTKIHHKKPSYAAIIGMKP